MLPQLVSLGVESQTLQLLSIPKTNTQPITGLEKPGSSGRHDAGDAEREEYGDWIRGSRFVSWVRQRLDGLTRGPGWAWVPHCGNREVSWQWALWSSTLKIMVRLAEWWAKRWSLKGSLGILGEGGTERREDPGNDENLTLDTFLSVPELVGVWCQSKDQFSALIQVCYQPSWARGKDIFHST